MDERKYSIREIDKMRAKVENKWLWGCFDGNPSSGCWSRTYNREEKIKAVEEMLRTYIVAGLGPEDLVDPKEN